MTDDMREDLALARAENDRHHANAYATASMDGMMGELARHEEAMSGLMDGMNDSLGHTSHCAGSGMEAMMRTMGDMRAAMTSHRIALEAAPGLAAARAECDAHFAAVVDMMGSMDGMLAEMRTDCM
jgi:hypothetical protein